MEGSLRSLLRWRRRSICACIRCPISLFSKSFLGPPIDAGMFATIFLSLSSFSLRPMLREDNRERPRLPESLENRGSISRARMLHKNYKEEKKHVTFFLLLRLWKEFDLTFFIRNWSRHDSCRELAGIWFGPKIKFMRFRISEKLVSHQTFFVALDVVDISFYVMKHRVITKS